MEDSTRPYGPSGARIALMAVFAFIAIVAFVLLVDVRRNFDDPIVDGVSDAASRQTMTLVLLGLETLALLGILILLFIRPYGPSTEEWTSTGGAKMGGDGSRIQIGCPGCGTVFEKPLIDVDEPHEQDFRCPNCDRAGRLRMSQHKPVNIRDVACNNCAREFKAYRKDAECPHCHAANSSIAFDGL